MMTDEKRSNYNRFLITFCIVKMAFSLIRFRHFFLLQNNTKTMKANNEQPVRKSIIWTFPIFSFHESTNVN